MLRPARRLSLPQQALDPRHQLSLIDAAQLRAQNQLLLVLAGGLLFGLAAAAALTWKLRRRNLQLAKQNAALVHTTTAAQEHAAARDQLYAMVAHDLQEPLAAFGGVSQLVELYLQQRDGASLRQLMPLLRQTARDLSELLHNLLGWTQSQTNELAYRPEQLLLAPLLAHVSHHFAASVQARGLTLDVHMSSPGLHAWADDQMMRTVLQNLVGNALRFTPAGGRVLVRATQVAGGASPGLCLEVTDTGSGMSTSQIRALLEAAPADAPLLLPHDLRAGTGLGLRLCLAFVRWQGGELTIESGAGIGTTVRVRLPMQAPAGVAVLEDALVEA